MSQQGKKSETVSTPKMYPLTNAQQLLAFALKYCPKKQLLNIGTSLTVGGDLIDFTDLEKAVRLAYERMDSMRLRLYEDEKGNLMQYVVEKDEREIEYRDFTGWKFEDAEAELKRWTEIPFTHDGSPLNRLVLLTMPDGFRGFYLNVNHMTMDSGAIIVFIKDVVELYCHMKYDFPFPKPLYSYIDVLEKDLEYENNSERFLEDKAFWEAYIARSEPIFTDITGEGHLKKAREEVGNPNYRACRVPSESVEARHDEFHLEREPTLRLLEFCLENRIPMVCLLLLGIRTFLSKMNGDQQDVSIKSAISRRGSIQKKKCGGTRIHSFPCRTCIAPETTFMEALHHIQQSQFEIFRHADFDPVAVMNMMSQHYNLRPGDGYDSISLTYQPMTMRANTDALRDVQYKTKWYSNGVAAQPLYLTVMHNSIDEGMDFYYEYQPGRVSFKDLEYMYYYLCKIVFMGVENPQITIGEILHTV